jgi:OmpA-OmpF porin, OOP family
VADKTNIDEILKKEFKQDVVDLGSKHQIVGNAYQGFISYEIKTKDKEIYIQLQPFSIGSYFYTLLVVEKQIELVKLNTNNENQILKDLNANKTAISKIDFELDSDILLSQSKDEILLILGVLQAHKDWKLGIEVHQAPIGKTDDNQALSQKRANAIKVALEQLGVNANQIIATGIGDKKPLTSNDTEKGRATNTRVEIRKM